MNEEKFGERLKKAAEKVGGQAGLARLTGISSRSVSAYVSGKADPSRERLIAMARATGVSVEWLATGEEIKQKGENQESETGNGSPVSEADDNIKGELKDDINVQQLLNMTARVLMSDTIYRPALAANIKAFNRSIDIENDNRELRSRLERIEEKMVALEERLGGEKKAAGG